MRCNDIKTEKQENLCPERLVPLPCAIVNEGEGLPGGIFGITAAITVSTLHRE